MKIPDRRSLIVGAAVLAVGLVIGATYGQVSLHRQAKVYETRIREANRRLAQTQRKYTQGLAAQTAVEEEKAAALAEVEKLEKRNAQTATEKKAFSGRIDSLSALNSSLQEKLGRAEAKAASEESKTGSSRHV